MDRRAFLSGAVGAAALTPAAADASIGPVDLRGTIDANRRGLVPGAPDDQGRLLQALLNEAARGDRPLFLPPGRYRLSNVVMPARTRLSGVPGATHLLFAGSGHLLLAENAETVALSGLVLDGNGFALADYVSGLLHVTATPNLVVDDCMVVGSSRSGIDLERVAGRVTRTTVTGARDVGIRAIESGGLTLADNLVADCGNGGIHVWRWRRGEDGTRIADNRIERIAAAAGGVGENGNAIHVFRADGVIVSGNTIRGAAFSGIRVNSARNTRISGNAVGEAGEAGILSEFGSTGTLIADNIVERTASGITVAGVDEEGHAAVIAGNIVRRLTGSGPYAPEGPGFGVGIAVEAGASVSGNVVEDAPLYGIMLGWGPHLRDVVATGNVIRGAPVGVAVSVVEGAGPAVIGDNLVSGAERGAVVGMRWSTHASGDLARSGADAYPHLTMTRNRVG